MVHPPTVSVAAALKISDDIGPEIWSSVAHRPLIAFQGHFLDPRSHALEKMGKALSGRLNMMKAPAISDEQGALFLSLKDVHDPATHGHWSTVFV